MLTHTDIQNYVRRPYGFVPKTCWIAHIRVMNGLPTRRAWNRAGRGRLVPCAPERRDAIEQAFRHFGLI